MIAALLGLLAAACATEPGPPPTVADIVVRTARDMNPNAEGEPSPVVLRVFRLADPGSFQRAAYDDLFEKDLETLGPDLIGTVDILIEPGSSETFRRTLGQRDLWLGFVVTFHDAETAQWRALAPVAPEAKTAILLEVGPRRISASTIEPATAAAPRTAGR